MVKSTNAEKAVKKAENNIVINHLHQANGNIRANSNLQTPKRGHLHLANGNTIAFSIGKR